MNIVRKRRNTTQIELDTDKYYSERMRNYIDCINIGIPHSVSLVFSGYQTIGEWYNDTGANSPLLPLIAKSLNTDVGRLLDIGSNELPQDVINQLISYVTQRKTWEEIAANIGVDIGVLVSVMHKNKQLKDLLKTAREMRNDDKHTQVLRMGIKDIARNDKGNLDIGHINMLRIQTDIAKNKDKDDKMENIIDVTVAI